MGNCLRKRRPTPKRDPGLRCRRVKLLLLGIAQVGKSTFIRNLLLNYGYYDENYNRVRDPYTEEDRRRIGNRLRQNALRNMEILLDRVHIFELEFENPENKQREALLRDIIGDGHLLADAEINDESMIAAEPLIRSLWADAAIAETFRRRREYHISDNVVHLIDRLSALASPGYRPTDEDLLMVQEPSTYQRTYHFMLDNVELEISDLGGVEGAEVARAVYYTQEYIRQNRLADRSTVCAILYIASLADYNQNYNGVIDIGPMPSDHKTTRLDASIYLFKLLVRLVSASHANNIQFLIFLNKVDTFRERLLEFDDFASLDGHCPRDADAAVNLVSNKFREHYGAERPNAETNLYAAASRATDLQNLPRLFALARTFIYNEHMDVFLRQHRMN